jgi:hypothetical protein
MNPVSGALVLLSIYAGVRLARLLAKSLASKLLKRSLEKIDSATTGRPDVRTILRQQVDNTPGQLLKLLVARALSKSHREPRNQRLADSFLALGAAVIGGPLGQDYKRAWTDDLNQAGADGKVWVVVMVNALSCLLSSPQIRWVEKVSPRLRDRFARQYRILELVLAAAARSYLSAFILIALPTTSALALIGFMMTYVSGLAAFGWAFVAFAIIEIPLWVHRWQRERQLAVATRRAAGTSRRT